MRPSIVLRPATHNDAELLWKWRNDPDVRNASRSTVPVELDEHVMWLRNVLADRHRRLVVAEEEGAAVGTVRVDCIAGESELSWTVAPEARGRGIGKRMVALLAGQIPGPIRAEIRAGHLSSIRVAEAAGMQYIASRDGFLLYGRPALPISTPNPGRRLPAV